MGYSHKTVTINEDDWNYLKSLNINCSEAIREFLHNLRNTKENNSDGIDVKLIQLKINQQRKQLTKLQAELKLNEQIIEEHERKELELQEHKLKIERERIDKESKCPNCHTILTDDNTRRINDKIKLCRSCALTSDVVKKYLSKK